MQKQMVIDPVAVLGRGRGGLGPLTFFLYRPPVFPPTHYCRPPPTRRSGARPPRVFWLEPPLDRPILSAGKNQQKMYRSCINSQGERPLMNLDSFFQYQITRILYSVQSYTYNGRFTGSLGPIFRKNSIIFVECRPCAFPVFYMTQMRDLLAVAKFLVLLLQHFQTKQKLSRQR